MGVARGHSESSLVRGNSLVRGFVFRGSTVFLNIWGYLVFLTSNSLNFMGVKRSRSWVWVMVKNESPDHYYY